MDDAHAEPAPAGVRGHARRVHLAIRKPDNWFELGRFLVVGASGYVVNLAVFYLADRAMPYPIAFILAFVIAATSNFVWNRWWTFRVHHGVPHHQYMRFLTVSALALGIDLIVLTTLVEWAGVAPLPAAAVAIVIATPVSFLGNKIWSFK
ncbi:MAG TPA: GtrA family protein [Gaiellales bacterium]|jgi:dolichol-phosphate mannosyltransferase|nr:GtrA family protein [Gaiellales bacterium]